MVIEAIFWCLYIISFGWSAYNRESGWLNFGLLWVCVGLLGFTVFHNPLK